MFLKTIAFKILMLIAFLLPLFFKANAQAADQLPAFKMLMTNGKFFSADELQKNKPVVLIYFAPDCEHCQVLMNDFFKKIDAFKNVQVVLITFKPVEEVAAFEKLYQTSQYENIKVGTEGTTFYLRKFYKLQNTPFTALYNKQGKLVYSYRKETYVNDLIQRVKQL